MPFAPRHLAGVKIHPKQARYQFLVDGGRINDGWTAFEDGEALAFGGLVETEDGAGAWLLFTDRMTPKRFLPVYRACRANLRILVNAGFRVVVDVAGDYPQAGRMAGLLGFKPLRAIEIDGQEMMRMIDA